MTNSRLQGLDGLRGIAILLVVNYHLWKSLSGQRVLPDGSLLTFLYAGNTGVTLFFVLSGLLVSLPFIKSLQHGELYSLRDYALQRALRILPPYYSAGLVGIACTGHTEQLLPMLLFRAFALDVGYFSTVWWSLATEVQFYLLLPLLFMAALSRWRIALLTLAFSLIVSLYLAVIFKVIGPAGPEGLGLKLQLNLSVIGQLPAFAIGLLLAGAQLRSKSTAIKQPFGQIGVVLLLILLGWSLLPAARVGATIYTLSTPLQVLPEALLWGGIIWLMLNSHKVRFSLLDNRLTRYFGRISFSLYLVHMPVLQLIQQRQDAYGLWLALAMTFILAVAVAQLSYWLVERLALDLKNKLSQPRPQPGIKV